MEDPSSKKLTKKQRKSLAFRERKAGKKKENQDDELENQLPELDLILDDEAEDPAHAPPSKKRKRDDSDSAQHQPHSKKLKDDAGAAKPKANPRFILFLGTTKPSLDPYTASSIFFLPKGT